MRPLEKISVEEWEERYKPIANVLDPNASWDGIMYETYGDDYNLVLKYPDNQIWSYIDTDNGTALIAGLHICDRIGYSWPVCNDLVVEYVVPKFGYSVHV